MGVMLFGNLFNTLMFGLLILLAWLLQRGFQRAPRLIYKFVASYGIAIVFDFVLLGIVDICRLVSCGYDIARTGRARCSRYTITTASMKAAASLAFS